jgi:hypothetical protein
MCGTLSKYGTLNTEYEHAWSTEHEHVHAHLLARNLGYVAAP